MTDENKKDDLPDEIWTTEDGRQIAISDLSEEHAKDILRMLIKQEREEKDYYNTHILPQLNGVIDSLDDMIIMHIDPRHLEPDYRKPTDQELTINDINDMFTRAGSAPDKSNNLPE